MATPVRIPRLGSSVSEATLVEWILPPGAPVTEGQLVALLEADKTEFEVRAPADGVLGAPLVGEGALAAVGTVVALVHADGEPLPGAAGQVPTASPIPLVKASPRARRLAADVGIELTGVRPSGPDGLVVAADVLALVGAHVGDTHAGRVVRERRPLDPALLARTRALTEEGHARPQLVLTVEVDLGRLDELRSGWAATGGLLGGVTWTEVLVAAVARTLAEHTHLDVALDGDELVVFEAVDVGVARAAGGEADVAVVVEADRRSLPEISAALAAAEPSAETPGTVTVWDPGALGVGTAVPVLEAKESVRVAFGVVEPRAVVREGEVAVATVATMSVAFDRRVITDAAAATFLSDLRRRLESPDVHL